MFQATGETSVGRSGSRSGFISSNTSWWARWTSAGVIGPLGGKGATGAFPRGSPMDRHLCHSSSSSNAREALSRARDIAIAIVGMCTCTGHQ